MTESTGKIQLTCKVYVILRGRLENRSVDISRIAELTLTSYHVKGALNVLNR